MQSSSLCQNHFLYNASYLIFLQQGRDLLNPNFSPWIDNLLFILISKSWSQLKRKEMSRKANTTLQLVCGKCLIPLKGLPALIMFALAVIALSLWKRKMSLLKSNE